MLNKLTCPYPDNISPLSSGGFMLSIQKSPNVKFWCNQVNLPGLTLGSTNQATPFTQIPAPGDALTFDPLSVQFMIDSRMENYLEIWNWLYGLGFPESYKDFSNYVSTDTRGMKDNYPKTVSDGSLTILNNSNVPVQTIQLIDLYPTALTSLTLQANNSDVVYLIGDATFQYSHYKFV